MVTITNSGEYTVTSEGMGSVHYVNTAPGRHHPRGL